MYNYGNGCQYNYGGYCGGYGYGCQAAPVAYPACGSNGCGIGLILVLFILLAIIGCGAFNGLGC